MDWIKENKFLSGFFGFVLLAAILLGVLCYLSMSGYAETKEEFEKLTSTAKNLEGQKLYPNQMNLDKKEAQVKAYAAKANGLQEALVQFQKPLVGDLSESAFQEKLKDRVQRSKNQATELGITTYEAFNLGMDKYVSLLPRKAAIPELDFSLDAIDNVMQMLYDARITSVNMITRDEIGPEEVEKTATDSRRKKKKKKKGNAPKAVLPKIPEGEVISRYPFYVTFTGSMRSIEEFLNSISNTESGEDNSFIYAMRYMRMENEKKEGPSRSMDKDKGVDPETGVDSFFVLGNEKITMMAAIDAVRFKTAEEAQAEKDAAAKASKDKGKK